MTVFAVGEAKIARIEETYQPVYAPRDLFPEWNEEIFNRHRHWLVPNHFDPATGLIKLSVHSWLLQIGGKNILIDACCGNQKDRPTRPFWNMLNTPYLERLAAAGARPDEIDLVMCTHLHHDHVGWNTQLRDGRWVPTFPNARYVFSKPDFEYYLKADADPQTAPVEFGTFRECVLPVVEAGRADLVTGPHRLNEHIEIAPAPGHSAAMWCSSWRHRDSRRSLSATCFTTCCKSTTRTGISRRTRTPIRRGQAGAWCWSTAHRRARSLCPATSERHSPAMSIPSRTDSSRVLVSVAHSPARHVTPFPDTIIQTVSKMKIYSQPLTILSFSCWLLLAMPADGYAQTGDYPSKPVRVIVDSAAGSANDATARILADKLSRIWNQQVLTVNQPGAGGSISARGASTSPADGYTLYLPATSPFLALPGGTGVAPNLPIELPRDFASIAFVLQQPLFIGASHKSGIQTCQR